MLIPVRFRNMELLVLSAAGCRAELGVSYLRSGTAQERSTIPMLMGQVKRSKFVQQMQRDSQLRQLKANILKVFFLIKNHYDKGEQNKSLSH